MNKNNTFGSLLLCFLLFFNNNHNAYDKGILNPLLMGGIIIIFIGILKKDAIITSFIKNNFNFSRIKNFLSKLTKILQTETDTNNSSASQECIEQKTVDKLFEEVFNQNNVFLLDSLLKAKIQLKNDILFVDASLQNMPRYCQCFSNTIDDQRWWNSHADKCPYALVKNVADWWLWYACKKNKFLFVKRFLLAGVDVHKAIYRRSTGPNFRFNDLHYTNAIHYAGYYGNRETIDLFLQDGLSINQYDKCDNNVLFYALQSIEGLRVIDYLINKGAECTFLWEKVIDFLENYRYMDNIKDEYKKDGKWIFTEDSNCVLNATRYFNQYRKASCEVLDEERSLGRKKDNKLFQNIIISLKKRKTFTQIMYGELFESLISLYRELSQTTIKSSRLRLRSELTETPLVLFFGDTEKICRNIIFIDSKRLELPLFLLRDKVLRIQLTNSLVGDVANKIMNIYLLLKVDQLVETMPWEKFSQTKTEVEEKMKITFKAKIHEDLLLIMDKF